MIRQTPGQVIRDRKIGRVAALTLFTLAFSFGLARTGTTTVTTGERPDTKVGCTCATTVKGGSHATGGGGGGGGGTIHIGS